MVTASDNTDLEYSVTTESSALDKTYFNFTVHHKEGEDI